MDRRLLGNVLIITVLVLSGSGIMMYLMPFEKNIASLHTVFALLFIVAMILHIVNNKLPLKNYITGKRQKGLKKWQAPLVFSIVVLMAFGLYLDIPVLNTIYSTGNELRNKQVGKTEETRDYQIISIEKPFGNHKLSVELKKGDAFQYPLFAIWLEDSIGNYLETLYVSRVISSSIFDYGKKTDEIWESALVRRPEALPYWSHKRGIEAADGLFVPLNGALDLDAVSGATPTGSFAVKSQVDLDENARYRVLIELNQSYDWNEYYTKDSYPNDKVYSGSGQVGQPSLIYGAEIEKIGNTNTIHKIMSLIGHGHHSGENGNLYPDVSNITSAKKIANRIILTLE